MSDQDQLAEVSRLRQSMRGMILMIEYLAQGTVQSGQASAGDVATQMGHCGMQVTDHELRELWELARKRIGGQG